MGSFLEVAFEELCLYSGAKKVSVRLNRTCLLCCLFPLSTATATHALSLTLFSPISFVSVAFPALGYLLWALAGSLAARGVEIQPRCWGPRVLLLQLHKNAAERSGE